MQQCYVRVEEQANWLFGKLVVVQLPRSLPRMCTTTSPPVGNAAARWQQECSREAATIATAPSSCSDALRHCNKPVTTTTWRTFENTGGCIDSLVMLGRIGVCRACLQSSTGLCRARAVTNGHEVVILDTSTSFIPFSFGYIFYFELVRTVPSPLQLMWEHGKHTAQQPVTAEQNLFKAASLEIHTSKVETQGLPICVLSAALQWSSNMYRQPWSKKEGRRCVYASQKARALRECPLTSKLVRTSPKRLQT
eukprot:scaffold107659_cov31-Tisochrysis_lutea.AAC.1